MEFLEIVQLCVVEEETVLLQTRVHAPKATLVQIVKQLIQHNLFVLVDQLLILKYALLKEDVLQITIVHAYQDILGNNASPQFVLEKVLPHLMSALVLVFVNHPIHAFARMDTVVANVTFCLVLETFLLALQFVLEMVNVFSQIDAFATVAMLANVTLQLVLH